MWRRCVLMIVVFMMGGFARAEEPVSFERAVAPILVEHCVRCHRAESKKGDVSLVSAVDLKASEAVEPGKPGESLLLEIVSAADDGGKPKMPKEGKALTSEQVSILRRWIEQGAAGRRG